jgi:hypothetical protein
MNTNFEWFDSSRKNARVMSRGFSSIGAVEECWEIRFHQSVTGKYAVLWRGKECIQGFLGVAAAKRHARKLIERAAAQ